jgi:CrcB protein
MITFLYVIFGGAIGSGLRYILSKSFSHILIFNIPIIILVVNIIGSFLMGLVFQYANQNEISENMKLFLTAGILGSFTTFSMFSLETYNLINQDKITEAVIYITASVLLSIFALFLGIMIMKK